MLGTSSLRCSISTIRFLSQDAQARRSPSLTPRTGSNPSLLTRCGNCASGTSGDESSRNSPRQFVQLAAMAICDVDGTNLQIREDPLQFLI